MLHLPALLDELSTERIREATDTAARRRVRALRPTVDADRRAVERLRPLLAAAATSELGDARWPQLRAAASTETDHLVRAGRLPRHLAVDVDDPPVVVTRTLAAAWRYVTRTPGPATG